MRDECGGGDDIGEETEVNLSTFEGSDDYQKWVIANKRGRVQIGSFCDNVITEWPLEKQPVGEICNWLLSKIWTNLQDYIWRRLKFNKLASIYRLSACNVTNNNNYNAFTRILQEF